MTEKTQPSGTIPDHYRKCCGIIEPRVLLKRLPFQLGNACKYLLRAPHKESEEKDLLKALDYLTWAMEEEEATRGSASEFWLLASFFNNRYLNVMKFRRDSNNVDYESVIGLVKARLRELGHDVDES